MYRLLTGLSLVAALLGTSTVANAQMGYGHRPQGSYMQSCTNIRMRGSVLAATCTGPQGQRIYSTLDVSRCPNSTVDNQNGYLTCTNGYSNNYYGHRNHRYYGANGNAYGGQGYRYLPGGSYQSSCVNATLQGSALSASCTAANGQRITSSINVNMCASRGTDIRNDNGYLRC